MRKLSRFAAVACALAVATTMSPVVAEAAAPCRSQYFPVRIGAEQHRVFGQLCAPGRDAPLQVLLHGGTYDHRYWDWPYQPHRYSYVHQATRHGYATLNLDRIGYGRSDHPDPENLDFDVHADVVHQVIEQVRPRFDRIILNGHSMGGITAERAAALGGVDAVIISGIPANPVPERVTDGPDVFYPAEQDPKFAGRDWAPGYLTTRPGTRAEAFLFPGTHDPAMPRIEEAVKDTLSVAELRSVNQVRAATTVPTLYVLGRHDLIACAGTADCRTDPNGAGVDYVVPDSGHSINVSRGAPRFYARTLRWLSEQGLDRPTA